jgi:hypothetical protein
MPYRADVATLGCPLQLGSKPTMFVIGSTLIKLESKETTSAPPKPHIVISNAVRNLVPQYPSITFLLVTLYHKKAVT